MRAAKAVLRRRVDPRISVTIVAGKRDQRDFFRTAEIADDQQAAKQNFAGGEPIASQPPQPAKDLPFLRHTCMTDWLSHQLAASSRS
jgi:hypothetical protein